MTISTMTESEKSRLFNLSCIALIVTAMTFAIRAGILTQLGEQYGLSGNELGWVNAMAFLGFPLATAFGGFLYNALGARRLIWLAFVCHLLGLVLTIFADNFLGLLISTFLIGFANGSVEAGCNPIIADIYPNNKTTMLNRFHVWFPGGIVIGALVSFAMTQAGISWQWQIATMIIPTIIYGVMLFGATFPVADAKLLSTTNNLRHLFTPMYIFLIACMTLTATAELGTQQWIEKMLGNSGAHPMVILAMITGIMAVGRFFAGPLVHRFNPTGVLLGSAVTTTIGIFLMMNASGALVYVAAVVFALGVTYFWPTMIGSVAEYTPQTGALGMSLAGGAGMFAVSAWNPFIGGWFDAAEQSAKASGITDPTAIAAVAGPAVLSNMIYFPMVLIVLFGGFFFFMRNRQTAHTEAENPAS
ncbi:MFS transporter [Glaciecola sp. 1036]|uniref:MFS transporter n=1 Tax=Alteromonadaceae TaxID=72275 RepID=UPI003D060CB6